MCMPRSFDGRHTGGNAVLHFSLIGSDPYIVHVVGSDTVRVVVG